MRGWQWPRLQGGRREEGPASADDDPKAPGEVGEPLRAWNSVATSSSMRLSPFETRRIQSTETARPTVASEALSRGAHRRRLTVQNKATPKTAAPTPRPTSGPAHA
jgi:hypothetical protein